MIKYTNDKTHVTLHIRRGDIMQTSTEPRNVYLNRYVNENLFFEILENIVKNVPRKYVINIVSDGNIDIMRNCFDKLNNENIEINYLINASKSDTIFHMIFNDIFIGSPSGFSHLIEYYGTGLHIFTKTLSSFFENTDLKYFYNYDKIEWKQFELDLNIKKNANIIFGK